MQSGFKCRECAAGVDAEYGRGLCDGGAILVDRFVVVFRSLGLPYRAMSAALTRERFLTPVPCKALAMEVPARSLPQPQPDDRGLLTGWLDWQRATVRAKCEGIDDLQARRSFLLTSPRLTIAGIVDHLTAVERGWMIESFLGERHAGEVEAWGESSRRLSELLDSYDRQCERSREIERAHDLETLEQFAPEGLQLVSLRWILGHLIEETARHLEHLDILRELTDGSRGY